MRILFVSWRDLAHPNAGGSEVVVDRLVRGLSERGHEVALLCGGPVGARPYRTESAGGTFDQYLRAGVLARRRFGRVDLVIDVVNGVPFLSPVWWRGPRLALIHHVHGVQWRQYFPEPLASGGILAERHLLPRLYRDTPVVTISPSSRDDLVDIGFRPEQLHVIINGIDRDLLTRPGPPSEEPMFLALGRVAPNKRLDLLLDMWPRVRAATGGRLVLAGGGPDLERLRARVRDEQLSGIALTGVVDDATRRRLLDRAWLLVHAAGHEGWGLVIAEAAARGTPSLAFDVAGVRDAVVDGVTGVLVRSPRAFADEWIALAADPARRQELGAAARQRAAELTWDATVDLFEKLAMETIGS